MATTCTEWLGNYVFLHAIEDTGLTVVQWRRPRHGTWRGARILDAEELRSIDTAVGELDKVRRDPDAHGDHAGRRYLREDLAGSPLHLESLLTDLLER